MPDIYKNYTDQSFDVFIEDASSISGVGLTGLLYNSPGLKCNVRRGPNGDSYAFGLVAQTPTGIHTDGGFCEIDNTGMPGLYRFDGADNMFVDGAEYVSYLFHGAANMMPCPVRVSLKESTVNANVVSIYSQTLAARYLASGALVMQTGKAIAGTLSTTQMTTNLTETNEDQIKDRVVIWTAGVNFKQAKQITAYDGAGLITYNTATDAPSAGDTFIIV